MSYKCQNYAAFRFTWSGRDESFACLEHAKGISAIAFHIGYPLQMIPLAPCEESEHPKCASFVKEPALPTASKEEGQ